MFGSAHWKLDAIDEYAGERPAAWIDDNIDDYLPRRADGAATLIVETLPAVGLTDEHVRAAGLGREVTAVRDT